MKKLLFLLLFASRVSATPTPTLTPAPGDCCQSQVGPGCNDPTCYACVCAGDPVCCDPTRNWDYQCSLEALGQYTVLVSCASSCACSSTPTITPTATVTPTPTPTRTPTVTPTGIGKCCDCINCSPPGNPCIDNYPTNSFDCGNYCKSMGCNTHIFGVLPKNMCETGCGGQATITPNVRNTFTPTNTRTVTGTSTPTLTPTQTQTNTSTPTITNTPTITQTPTITRTFTVVPTPTGIILHEGACCQFPVPVGGSRFCESGTKQGIPCNPPNKVVLNSYCDLLIWECVSQ